MEIDVTAQNIDDYGLDELTGNTKEELLRMASEAHRSGMDLKFKIPDAASSERRMNVFDSIKGQPVAPEDLEHTGNPIEDWDGQEIPYEANVETHVCDFPITHALNDTWTCRHCRVTYFAEPDPNEALGFKWIQAGEIE